MQANPIHSPSNNIPGNSGGKFAICESGSQVAWLLSHPDLLETVDHMVAANPDAAWALQKRGIEFVSLDDYDQIKPLELTESLVEEQIRWAQWSDSFLQDAIPQFKRTNFQPTRYYVRHLKIIWDTVFHTGSILEQLATYGRPDEVLFFANIKPFTINESCWLQGSALAETIPDWAQYYHIKQEVIPGPKDDTFWKLDVQTRPNIIKRILSHLPAPIYTKIRTIYYGYKLKNTVSSISPNAGHSLKVIFRQHYDLTPEVWNKLRTRGVTLVSFDDILVRAAKLLPSPLEIQSALESAWESIICRTEFWLPDNRLKWSIRKIVQPLLKQFWLHIIPKLWQCMIGAYRVIERQNPAAVAAAISVDPPELGLIMAARKAQIPVIFYIHGVSMGEIETPSWDMADRYLSDYMLLYGEGQAQYIQGRPNRDETIAKPIVVGSARLDKVRKSNTPEFIDSLRKRIVGNSQAPIILYVPSSFQYNIFRYLGRNTQRDISLFNIRRRIASLFNNHPEINFVYKTFVSHGNDPTLDMLEMVYPECIIVRNIGLADLQWAADALIHEAPSTGMCEGLLTNKPMIVYVNRDVYRMNLCAKEMLAKRVVLAENGTDFVHSVEALVSQSGYSAIPDPDQNYLKVYATYLNDGQSAIRAADVIYNIISGSQLSK